MKILHTSDWHLGKKLMQFSRLPEQEAVLAEIIEIADREAVDLVLIAGDLFDTVNPPVEALHLFYRTLKKLAAGGKRPVIAIAGNHDSPDRIDAPDPLARECGIIMAGYPKTEHLSFTLEETGLVVSNPTPGLLELKLPGWAAPVRLLLTPYANELRLKEFLGFSDKEASLREHLSEHWAELAAQCDEKGTNILLGHLFAVRDENAEVPEEPEDEKPIRKVGGLDLIYANNFPVNLDYVALGHLHRPQVIQEKPYPIVYSGSPLSYSFSEAAQQKKAFLIDAELGKSVELRQIELLSGKKLYRKTFTQIPEALTWLSENQNSYVELTLATDNYLSVEENQALHEAHPGIVAIIPKPQLVGVEEGKTGYEVDLSQSALTLFTQFFKYKNDQEPPAELLSLFEEILGTEVGK